MLTNSGIKEQISLGNIVIENMREGALNKPNSCDISIGNTLYTFDVDEIVDTRHRHEFLNEVLADKPFNLKKVIIPEEGLVLEPHKLYLTKTVERVETHGYIPVMNGKTAFSLLGVSTELNSGYKTENYNGHMLISLIATRPTIIYPDIKIGNLTFFPSLNSTEESRVVDSDYIAGIYESGMLSGVEIKKRMNHEGADIIIDDTSKIVINPNSVNLTLNSEYGTYEDKILDVRKKPKVIMSEIGNDGIILKRGEIYLARTNEYTETYNLVPMISGRSSLGRVGLHIHCSAGMGSIGYKGYWHLGLRPISDILIKKDTKCCQIYYFTTEGEIETQYRGYMQDLPKGELGSQAYKALALTKKGS